MQFFAPLLIFGLLTAPAVRLLTVAYRTRQTPEIWGGFYFLGIGLGIPLRVLGHSLMISDPANAVLCNAVGHLFFAGGACAMTVFTWQVFRLKAGWAQTLAIALIASIVLSTLWVFAAGALTDEESGAVLVTNLARVVPTIWAFTESLRYWRAMRRRERIGLADAVVTNRFLLWAIWTGALTALPLLTLLVRVVSWIAIGAGFDASEVNQGLQHAMVGSLVRVVFITTGPIGAAALCLSFFPPRRYLAFIRDSHQPLGPGAPAR